MDEGRPLLELKNDEEDDQDSLCEIGNVLSKESFQKMVVQSQEQCLNNNIKDVRYNVALQEKVLQAQHNNALDHGCLLHLDYIFQRSLVSISNTAQFEIILKDKVDVKRANITKLREQFAEQFNGMLLKYMQLHDRKLLKCELQQEIGKKEKLLQDKKNIVQSLEQEILTQKADIKKRIEKINRSKEIVIIKFADLVHAYNQEVKHRLQLTKNDEIKKILEGRITALQTSEIGNIIKQHFDPENGIIGDIPIGGEILSIASLPRGGSTVPLNANDPPCLEPYQEFPKKFTIRKDTTKHSKSISEFNTSFAKSTTSFRNESLYSNLPYLKTMTSTKLITTSKYFESSIYLKSNVERKQLQPTVGFLKKSKNDKTRINTTMIDPKLSKPTSVIDIDASKESLFQYEKANDNPKEMVQFSSEIKQSYFNNAQVKEPPAAATTKIDVINIIREDIVRRSVQSKTSEPDKISPAQNITEIQMNDNELDMGGYGDSYNFFNPTYSQFLEVTEAEIQNESSDNDDNDELNSRGIEDNLFTTFKFNK